MAPPSPAHASIADARAADPHDAAPTAWMNSLNGRWQFRLFDHPDLAKWLLEEGISSISLNPDTVVQTGQFLAQQIKN